MKENGNKSEDTLCHVCRWGGEIVEQCNCPKLTAWTLMPKTIENIKLIAAGEAVAKSKGIKDFNPLAYIAVTLATIEGKCKYYRRSDKYCRNT